MGTSGQVCETYVQMRCVLGVGVCRNAVFTLVFQHIFKIARDGRSKSCIDVVAFLACNIIGKCVVFHVFSSVI